MLYVFMLTDRPMITMDNGHDVCHSYSVEADNLNTAIDEFAHFMANRHSTTFDESRMQIEEGLDNGKVQFVIPTPV